MTRESALAKVAVTARAFADALDELLAAEGFAPITPRTRGRPLLTDVDVARARRALRRLARNGS